MYKKNVIILLIIFFSISNYSAQSTTFYPDISLYNDNILNIPPLKIEGFTLGMIFEKFELLIKKKFTLDNIKKLILKETEPKIVVYKIDNQSTEHFAFYIYGNFLGKIKIINMRPFEFPEIIIKRFIDRYDKPDKVWEFNFEQYTGLYWKYFTWKKYYQYTPQFSSIKLDMLINITIHLNMNERFIRKVVYGYSFDNEFLKLHFNSNFNW